MGWVAPLLGGTACAALALSSSLPTIEGTLRGVKRGRHQIRSSCRAEWGRLFEALEKRVGGMDISHVRSHARGGDGEIIEWGSMNKKQKMNHVADRLANEGGE